MITVHCPTQHGGSSGMSPKLRTLKETQWFDKQKFYAQILKGLPYIETQTQTGKIEISQVNTLEAFKRL